MLVTT